MQYRNLTIVGTSHIAQQSLDEVRTVIENVDPDIIAIELDRKRLHALLNKTKRKIRLKDIRRIGIKGFIFSLVGAWASDKLGKMVGISPGSEMKEAIYLARERKKIIALIDQDIEITLRRISQTLTWKERFRFVIDIIKGFLFGKRELKKLGIESLDLTKVPSKELIRKLIKKVKVRYPNIYKVLIDERNKVMAVHLGNLMQSHPEKKIVAIMGAGHEEEIIKILKKAPVVQYQVG